MLRLLNALPIIPILPLGHSANLVSRLLSTMDITCATRASPQVPLQGQDRANNVGPKQGKQEDTKIIMREETNKKNTA